MQTLARKIAIVTGASRGIGAAIAKRLAADGAAVVVNYANSPEAARAVVGEIEAKGGTAVAVHGDLRKLADVKHLVQSAVDRFGRIHILVNSVATMEMRPVGAIDEEHFSHAFDVNVRAATFAVEEALPHFAEDGARIINISSGVVNSPQPMMSIYAATKGALDVLTRCWSRELGAKKITVNGVSPGVTDTDGIAGMPPGFKEMIAQRTALGRLGRPEDIADVVAFLASDDARWVTGHILDANGGLS